MRIAIVIHATLRINTVFWFWFIPVTRPAWLALALAIFLGCSSGSVLPVHTEFQIGASKAKIQTRFGTPDRMQTFHKAGDDAIWGAIETFWATLPPGSSVEVWSYRSENSEGLDGHTELYFVDHGETVGGLAFSPDGVVYEALNTDAQSESSE